MDHHHNRAKRIDTIVRKDFELCGASSKADEAIEKMAELTASICKHRRGAANVIQIAEGIAEVEILMEQLKMIFSCHDLVADWENRKIEDLRERLLMAGKVVKEVG